MKKAVKKRWIEALESGYYRQGRDKLATKGEKFCCLGVLYDIEYTGEWEWVPDSNNWHDYIKDAVDCYEIDGSTTGLSNKMLKRVGLTAEEQDLLMRMNDDGQSFQDIADHIKETL